MASEKSDTHKQDGKCLYHRARRCRMKPSKSHSRQWSSSLSRRSSIAARAQHGTAS
ncbi:hypothetical protein SNOG_11537 [Parastagonospora nodorum SN15]|uniref:Uncharacterized protein n=1 Tax=Phaeosphaeria nodorum (strain SN15 / ATCC MYA-4574 / FGSC 10173) TaxID=321614 RepID=Q0U9M7_PHANO|nr:hypothetical protein SNOG_11537 [Parastagonospora nodorum SN15]EAT81245.2 hypothetical protein SNOG_11537 [Parastagonospora nodorum SN15]